MPTNVSTTQVWTLQNVDTARVGRYHDGVFLSQGSATPNGGFRQGVVATAVDGLTLAGLLVKAQSPESLSCDVTAGNAFVDRSGQGPYAAMFTGISTITFDAAHATLPRIDRVDLVINDAALGDVGTNATITITTGTAAASPTVPADPAPGRSIPLATVTRPANDNTIAAGDIMDTRKSTAPLGMTRNLLPGDSLTDPGFVFGERVNTVLKDPSMGARIREWDGAQWRDQDAWNPASRGFRYRRASTQIIPTGVDTDVAFPTAVIAASPHVTVSGAGNTRFTLNREGWWTLSANISFTDDAGGYTYRVFIRDYTVNTSVAGERRVATNASGGETVSLVAHVYITLGAPRQFAVNVFQNSGSDKVLAIDSFTDNTSFSGVWMGK